MSDGEGCLSCAALRGEQRISPGPPIHEGAHWVVEHAYPAALAGWLVLVLRRHAGALHELTADEWAELAALQARTVALLRHELHCEKEYIACFAEAPGYHHVHVHVVPRAADLPEELRGNHVFALLGPDRPERGQLGYPTVPEDEVRALCERLRDQWARRYPAA